MEYTAVIKHVDKWWIGWIEEFPGSIARKEHEKNF
jgi:hypothetical protein